MSKPSWRTDKRSAAARGYDARWRKRRRQQLSEHPLCCFCQREGRVRLATVADHVTPHKGDPVLFEGPLQSLCGPCHSGDKQRVENGGVPRRRISLDGWPV
jgi:5-methylcytosine-specific restriction protein A